MQLNMAVDDRWPTETSECSDRLLENDNEQWGVVESDRAYNWKSLLDISAHLKHVRTKIGAYLQIIRLR